VLSEAAITWAQGQRCATPTAKFLLMRLAAYADAEGVAWAFVERLADEMQTTDRTVQRSLRALEKVGLVRKTGRFKGRNGPYYALDLDRPATVGQGRTVTRVSPLNGDMGVTVGDPNGDMGVTPNGDMGVTPKQGKPSSVEDKSSPSERAGAREAGQLIGFEAAFAAYPPTGRDGVSSRRQAELAYAEEIADGGDPAVILAGVAAYAGDRRLWGASGRPKAFHNFLKSAVWRDLASQAAVAAAPPPVWCGPAEIRAALVGYLGEDAVRASLDMAGWCEADRVILARSTYAAGRLSKDAHPVLSAADVSVKFEPKGVA
jgi:DNA-binding transcriptional ArsR family regulator